MNTVTDDVLKVAYKFLRHCCCCYRIVCFFLALIHSMLIHIHFGVSLWNSGISTPELHGVNTIHSYTWEILITALCFMLFVCGFFGYRLFCLFGG